MATSGVGARTPGTITVLFVDDDDDTRLAYQTLAAGEGMNARVARNGHEAIALASVVLPDVIVLDVGLRARDDVDGIEVAHRLRADENTRSIPIVIVSGYDGESDRAAVRSTGCEGYLVKPCLADDLLALLTSLAANRRKQQASCEIS